MRFDSYQEGSLSTKVPARTLKDIQASRQGHICLVSSNLITFPGSTTEYRREIDCHVSSWLKPKVRVIQFERTKQLNSLTWSELHPMVKRIYPLNITIRLNKTSPVHHMNVHFRNVFKTLNSSSQVVRPRIQQGRIGP